MSPWKGSDHPGVIDSDQRSFVTDLRRSIRWLRGDASTARYLDQIEALKTTGAHG